MIRLRLIAVLVLAFTLFSGSTALANSAPPRWFGQKGGAVLPGASSQIHVLRERLRFEVKEPQFHQAEVTALYQMENRGPALSGFPVLFVIEDSASSTTPVTVTWDGKPVAAAPVDTSRLTEAEKAQMASAWGAMKQLIDPVTGDRYATSDFFGKTALRFVQFALDLPAGKSGALSVNYVQTSAMDRQREIYTLYHYQYLILPAKAWASFGPLEIAVKAPGPDRAFFKSTLPMQYKDGEYRASFAGLPPEDLAFSLMSRKGLIGNLTNSTDYYFFAFLLLLLVTGLLGWGLGRLSAKVKSRGWAIGVAVLVGLIPGGIVAGLLSFVSISLFPALADQSYGNLFSGVGMGFVATCFLTIFAGVTASRRHRRLNPQ